MWPEAARAGNSQRMRPDAGGGFPPGLGHASRAATAAARARLETGTSRSRPPLPRTATSGASGRSAAVGSATSSLARSPEQ